MKEGQETKQIENQPSKPRLKNFDLNLIFTCNICTTREGLLLFFKNVKMCANSSHLVMINDLGTISLSK